MKSSIEIILLFAVSRLKSALKGMNVSMLTGIFTFYLTLVPDKFPLPIGLSFPYRMEKTFLFMYNAG